MTQQNVLAFDFGTGGVRAGVFSVPRGQFIGYGDAGYRTVFPRPSWAEQDPDDWIVAMRTASWHALTDASVDGVAAVCVAATSSTVVACSSRGLPTRPAILWMDTRASAEARRTADVDHPVMDFSGGADAAEWLVPKAMWLKRHQPDIFSGSEVICETLDFVNHHLTGVWAGSELNATCKWNYDRPAGDFPRDLFESLEVPELPDKLPTPIVPVGMPLGTLTTEAAEEIGLANRPMVVQGGIDAHMAMLGAGCVDQGDILVVAGTSTVVLGRYTEPHQVKGFWGPYPDVLVPDQWLLEAGQTSSGSVISWFVHDLLNLTDAEHQALIQECETASPDASLLVLDHWMGNRTPYRDERLRGALLGLTLGHTRADLYRSLVDGVALGTANIFATLEASNLLPERVVMAGGICKNPLWMQSTVDAVGVPTDLVTSENLTLRGAAVAAVYALGQFDKLSKAAREMAATAQTTQPSAEQRTAYRDRLHLYRAATEDAAPVLRELARQQEDRRDN